MDMRTRNRLREHTGDGHWLVTISNHSVLREGKSLHDCICGWRGWLDNQS